MGADILPLRGGYPSPPKHLKEEGKRVWKEGAALWAEGLITQRDLGEWQLYCEAWDEKSHCAAVLKKDGEYFTSAHGCIMEHPAIKRRQRAEAKIDKYSKNFGLVPDARKKRPAVQQGVTVVRKK